MKILYLILVLYAFNTLCCDLYWMDQYPTQTTTAQEDEE